MNVSGSKISKVLVICKENSKECIAKILRPVKTARGSIKLGLLPNPWDPFDFYQQLANLCPENPVLISKINDQLVLLRCEGITHLNNSRLFLGVSEIERGFRVELGNDQVLSSRCVSADEYAREIEKVLLLVQVEFIEFSMQATTDLLPANVIALMMLINGFACKHKKEILFVGLPPAVQKQIEDFSLTSLLPIA